MNDRLTIPIDSLWSVYEPGFSQAIAALRGTVRIDAASLLTNSEPGFRREGDVAVVEIVGPLTKSPSWWSAFIDSRSYQGIQKALQAALASDATSILLRVDSPGGSTDGLAEVGDAIFAARSEKPVFAFVEGMAGSAAYYLASQATKIFAQRMDLVGSIGTRLMMYDFSNLFEKEGIRAIPIDTGEFKSAGAQGTKLTDRQIEYFQGIVDGYFKDFMSAIKRGRGMTSEQLEAVADGRMFLAKDAVGLGLIDGIGTKKTVLAGLSREAKQRGRGNVKAAQETTMSSEETKVAAAETKTAAPQPSQPAQPTAATLGELKSAIPGSDAAFREKCLEQGFTLPQAQAAWMNVLQEQLKAKDAELSATKAKAAMPGSDGVTTGKTHAAPTGDAESQWKAAVDAKIAAGFGHDTAVSAVARENPELHQAYLKAYNERHGRRVA